MCRKLFFVAALALALSLLVQNTASAADRSRLIGWWKFDGNTQDSSGLGNHGIAGGNPTYVPGKFSNGLNLDGDDYVAIDGVVGDLTSNNFTLSIWIKSTQTGEGNVIASNTTSSHVFQFGIKGGGNIWVDDGPEHQFPPAINDNQWHMMTFVKDGTTAYIYSDGVQVGTFATGISVLGETRWSIGQEWDSTDSSSPSDFYTGAVDDARFYDRPLPAEHVLSLANGIEPTFVKAENPLPADGATSPETWVSLGWSPGDGAVTHDVYFSDNLDDVTNGAADAFRGNQTLPFFMAGLGLPEDPYPNGLTPGTTYYWRVDEVEANGTTKYQGPVWSFSIPPRKAYAPVPRNRAKYAPMDVKLTWTAGFGAKLHTVYFGNTFDDVNNATTGGARQAPATYTPSGPLAKGTTYYWRVDEFDGLNTYKGDVWSFTTLADITITDPDLVGWWKFDEGFGNKALDFSGYGNDGTFGGDPEWIDGVMDGALYLDGSDYVAIDGVVNDITGTNITLSIWIKTIQGGEGNVITCNDSASGHPLMFGVRNGGAYVYDGASADYSSVVNDDQWHMLTYVRNGSTGYIYVDGVQIGTYSATFTLDSVTRWSIGQEWDSSTPSDFYTGAVDELRIYNKALTADEVKLLMRGDPLLAWNPNPDKDSTVDLEKAKQGLTWSPGDNATQHDVYFGTDQGAVESANASDTTGVYRGRRALASYTPTEVLAWGTGPYYWRIDEVKADGTISTGAVWSFSVANYLVVDDFESYNDINEGEAGSSRIYLTWIDGYGTATNGSQVGNLNPPFAETRAAYVHSGNQAMPVLYNNNRMSSQATRTLTAGRDWTREGVGNLSLWFRGDTANAAERIYVSINGKAPVYHTNANAAQLTTYTEWIIPLSTFAGQGTGLTNVTSITIGFGTPGNTTVVGGTGTAYIDDIRLYR